MHMRKAPYERLLDPCNGEARVRDPREQATADEETGDSGSNCSFDQGSQVLDVCGFAKPPTSQSEFLIRKHGTF